MSDTIHSSDSVISYVTWLFALCWRCRKPRFHRSRSRGFISRRKLTQPLLVEIKGDAAFATLDCRNPRNLSNISHSLGWQSKHTHTHTHTPGFWKMSLSILEHLRWFFVTGLWWRYITLTTAKCTVLAIVYRFKNTKTYTIFGKTF